MPFPPKLTPAQRQHIREAPPHVKTKDLAALYGVTVHGIRYWRNPDRKRKVDEAHLARLAFKRFINNSRDPRRSRKWKFRKSDLNEYEKQIHEAIGQGMGIDEIDRKLDENLSTLLAERLAIDKRMYECRRAQAALYSYLKVPTAVLDDSAEVLKEVELPQHMSAKEMGILMHECGLSIPRLATALSGRYSKRALQSYKGGQVPVPRPVAEFLKGCPKAQILNVGG